ncbi:hypothetical protein H2248_002162 [Termitomyces sp. 'cryptogamus']|nr:hypothetical protein H2248_002162 [Termitomyces sp. 'cryptogamus']
MSSSVLPMYPSSSSLSSSLCQYLFSVPISLLSSTIGFSVSSDLGSPIFVKAPDFPKNFPMDSKFFICFSKYVSVPLIFGTIFDDKLLHLVSFGISFHMGI